MRLLFVTNGDISDPSSRVRVYQYAPFLEKSVGQVSIVPLAACCRLAGRIRQLWILLASLFTDVVVIQKAVLPRLTLLLARILRRRMILDLDDGTFIHHPEMLKLLRVYRAIVVGNEELANYVRSYNK